MTPFDPFPPDPDPGVTHVTEPVRQPGVTHVTAHPSRHFRLSVQQLTDQDLNALAVMYPVSIWFRKRLEQVRGIVVEDLVDAPSEKKAGYAQALGDVLSILDAAGTEVAKRRKERDRLAKQAQDKVPLEDWT